MTIRLEKQDKEIVETQCCSCAWWDKEDGCFWPGKKVDNRPVSECGEHRSRGKEAEAIVRKGG